MLIKECARKSLRFLALALSIHLILYAPAFKCGENDPLNTMLNKVEG